MHLINCIGTDGDCNGPEIVGATKRVETVAESRVGHTVKDHVNVSVVSATIVGQENSMHCSKSHLSRFMSSWWVDHQSSLSRIS